MSQPRNSGKIVQLQDGRRGVIYNDDRPYGNKVMVRLDTGAKVLVRPEKLKTIGYFD
jgi:hypothetical protein